MKFSAVTDVDIRRSTYRRNSPDIPLEEEFTAEELLAFYGRLERLDEHKAQRNRAKAFMLQQYAYAKEIEDRNNKRRAISDKKASFKADIPSLEIRTQMLEADSEWNDPKAMDNAWASLHVTQLEPVCEDRAMLAVWLSADPHAIRWNTLVKALFAYKDGRRYTTPRLSALVAECRATAFPGETWNQKIREMEPSTKGGMAFGLPARYDDPTRPEHEAPGPRFPPKPDNAAEALRWMVAATNHQIPDRITKCGYSGQSLVEKGVRAGKSYWRIAPNWQGMSLGMARQAVSYAAVVAGICTGTKSGEAPPVVYKLAADGDAWCALAYATKHPDFYQEAKVMLMLRDRLYFALDDSDIRANMLVYERVSATAAREDKK